MGELARTGGHVFISYVREDSAHVDRLQRVFQKAGIPVWRDTAQLWPGQDWRAQIRRAITGDALIFLVCFSRASLGRAVSYQNEELVLAIEQLRLRPADDSWLIPVRFDDCQIPDRDIGAGRTLGSIHRADLFGNGYEQNAARLAEAILRRLDLAGGRAGQFALLNRSVTPGAGLAENADVSAVVNPWIRTPSDEPYVLAEDSAAVHRWNASLAPGDPRRIELHVLPEPVLGLHDAPVLLLMANPGSAPADRLIDRTWLTPVTSFGTFTGFLHAFAVPWAIVCDRSVYQFGTGKQQIFKQVLSAGIEDSDLQRAVNQASSSEPASFGELQQIGESNGIFTLAEGWDPAAESFEAYVNLIAPGQLTQAATVVGRSKPRQGRHVAAATDCPYGIDALYAKLLRRLGVTRDESTDYARRSRTHGDASDHAG